jgi:hypothetical protein
MLRAPSEETIRTAFDQKRTRSRNRRRNCYAKNSALRTTDRLLHLRHSLLTSQSRAALVVMAKAA